MKIITRAPQNENLKIDISHIYSLETEETETSYTIYPSNSFVLMFYQNAKLEFAEGRTTIHSDKRYRYSTIVVGPFNKSNEIIYSGCVKMVGIVFQNHGIYNYDNFDEFYLNEKKIRNGCFKSINLEKLFSFSSDEAIKYIEQSLLEVRDPIRETVLERCLHSINEDGNITLDTLSKHTLSSKKNIINKFKKYLGRTPSNFLTVNKFRNSLIKESDKLTDLAYQFGFYDQSHMIKKYRKLTGETPSEIKKKKSISNSEKLQWLS